MFVCGVLIVSPNSFAVAPVVTETPQAERQRQRETGDEQVLP